MPKFTAPKLFYIISLLKKQTKKPQPMQPLPLKISWKT